MVSLSFTRFLKRAALTFVLSSVVLAFSATIAWAIDPPTGLNVAAEPSPSRNINLTWSPVAGAVKYNVYRGLSQLTDKGQAEMVFLSIPTPNFTDSSGIVGETYFYQVTAVDALGNESVLSTGVTNDHATVSGKEFPHRGFSDLSNLCRNCHKIHRAGGVQRILRKAPEIEVCFTCHDGTGSDFNIRTVFEGQAAHDLRLAGKLGSNIKCEHCHFPHGTGFTRMAVRKEENLCFACHRSGGASPADGVSFTAPDLMTIFDTFEPLNNPSSGLFHAHPVKGKVDLHDVLQGVQGENANGGQNYRNMTAATRHAECPDCHNPHQATAANPLRGAAGIQVTNGASGTAPIFTFILAINNEHELCFKCHSSFNGSWNSTPWIEGVRGDKSVELNPANSAYHPVEAAGRNTSANLNNQLLGGLSTSSSIRCTDCHNYNATAVVQGPVSNFTGLEAVGPHGSANPQIRRGSYFTNISGPTQWNQSNFQLCFLCHNVDKLTARMAPWRDPNDIASTNFYDDVRGKDNLHRLHLVDKVSKARATCRNCHFNVHSNVQASNTQYNIGGTIYTTPPATFPTRLINFSPDITPIGGRPKPEWAIDPATKIRTCNLFCHGSEMRDQQYRPAQGDLP